MVLNIRDLLCDDEGRVSVVLAGRTFINIHVRLAAKKLLSVRRPDWEPSLLSVRAGLIQNSIISPAMFTYENPYLA